MRMSNGSALTRQTQVTSVLGMLHGMPRLHYLPVKHKSQDKPTTQVTCMLPPEQMVSVRQDDHCKQI